MPPSHRRHSHDSAGRHHAVVAGAVARMLPPQPARRRLGPGPRRFAAAAAAAGRAAARAGRMPTAVAAWPQQGWPRRRPRAWRAAAQNQEAPRRGRTAALRAGPCAARALAPARRARQRGRRPGRQLLAARAQPQRSWRRRWSLRALHARDRARRHSCWHTPLRLWARRPRTACRASRTPRPTRPPAGQRRGAGWLSASASTTRPCRRGRRRRGRRRRSRPRSPALGRTPPWAPCGPARTWSHPGTKSHRRSHRRRRHRRRRRCRHLPTPAQAAARVGAAAAARSMAAKRAEAALAAVRTVAAAPRRVWRASGRRRPRRGGGATHLAVPSRPPCRRRPRPCAAAERPGQVLKIVVSCLFLFATRRADCRWSSTESLMMSQQRSRRRSAPVRSC